MSFRAQASGRLIFASIALFFVACGGSAEIDESKVHGGESGTFSTSGTAATARGGTSSGGTSSSGGSGSTTIGGTSASAGAAGAPNDAGAPIDAGAGGSSSTPRSCDQLTFDDPALETVVRKWLNKPTGELTPQDAQQVTLLQASNAGIKELGGIECLPLSAAFLDGNQISNLSPLAAVKTLQSLTLSNSPVGDLSPLAGLDQLRSLDLSGAGRVLTPDDFAVLAEPRSLISLTLNFDLVGELTPLAKAPALTTLSLASAQVSAPGSLASLTQISTLELSNTGVTPDRIAQLDNLTYLGFQLNDVRDISPLALLTNLELLELSFNQLEDLMPLASMPKLQRVAVTGNRITDLGPLRALTNLTTVNAQDNRITTLTPLVQNMAIGAGALLWLGDNPLDCQAEAANIAALQARQVGLQSDCTAVPQP